MKHVMVICLCILLLTGCGAKPGQGSPETSRTPEPSPETTQAVPVQEITLYIPNEDASGFVKTGREVSEISAAAVFQALTEAGVLWEGAAANSLTVEGTQILLDVNDDFASQLCSYGTAGESMMIGSVVNTLLDAYQAETVVITVHGEILESGHVIYDFPLEFFEA